jgi:hypothetical protein
VDRRQEWEGSGSTGPIRARQKGVELWVISLNLHRRHLDTEQRAMVAVDAKPLLGGEQERDRNSTWEQRRESLQSKMI